MKKLMINGNTYDCNVDLPLVPVIERMLKGTTARDEAIQALGLPNRPVWLFLVVKLLRCYRKNISRRLGNRCVFDPSCSHYSELAFREKGFIDGLILTVKRLYRCRPGRGGVDQL